MAAINLTFDYIAVGIAVIEMDVDGKHYSFMSTYVGENPLNSLLSGLWYLKYQEDNYKESESSCKFVWQDEPCGHFVQLFKNNNDLHIVIQYFSDLSDPNSHNFEFEDIKLVLDTIVYFDDFTQEVCKAAINAINKYGILGYALSWFDDLNNSGCPMAKLLYLLGSEFKYYDKYLCFSNFDEELLMLNSLKNTISNNELLFSLPYFSKSMKAEIERTDWKFSDFETATIIYNWSLPYEKKTELLKQIAFVTTDLKLKTQINQRIKFDNLQLNKFKETTPNSVFIVQYSDHSIHGIYGDYATALKSCTDIENGFAIRKYQIISSNIKPVVSQTLVGIRNMNSEHQTEFDSIDKIPYQLGEMVSDKDDYLLTFYSCELDNEQTREVENLDSERFENAFVPYPVFFDKGDRVKVPKHNVSGVVYGTKEDYQKIIEQAKTNKIYDYVDTFIRIDFDGEGDHTHESPFLVELE
ncbi:MAG: hypothetical protein J6Z01_12900 [Bacteroidales bacterium]|nr:hypothetical protein [Bacteroidales bacterium]